MATSKRAMALSLECRWSRQPGHFSDLKLLNCPPDMIKKNSLAAYSFLHCVGWILWKQGSVNGRVCHLLGEEAHSLFQPPLQNEKINQTLRRSSDGGPCIRIRISQVTITRPLKVTQTEIETLLRIKTKTWGHLFSLLLKPCNRFSPSYISDEIH